MAEKLSLSFSIQGEFITNVAREKLYEDNNLISALKILMSASQTDEITENDRLRLALDILDGMACFKGTYPGDYHLETHNEREPGVKGIDAHFQKVNQRLSEAEKDAQSLQQKFLFLMENIPEYILNTLNDRYRSEFDEYLTEPADYDDQALPDGPTPMLDLFVKRMTRTKETATEDYGWLEPNGKFHPVEWGDHQKWAYDYIHDHLPACLEADGQIIKVRSGANETEILALISHGWTRSGDYMYLSPSDAGDELTARGWILLHSPSLGDVTLTQSQTKRLTKAQREFLFDYYTERGYHDQAQACLED